MHDRVADVLAQRATLDRGAGTAVVVAVLLHAGLAGLFVYSGRHASAPQPASFVSIQFAPMSPQAPAAATPRKSRTETPKPVAPPKVEEPKPRIEEPKPDIEKPAAKPEKNTVPLSPFGRSTKKGSESAAPAPQAPAAPAPSNTTGVAAGGADIPVGGTGVTGFEGGDFPYAIYVQAMNRKIGAAWARPQVTPGTATVVYFRIQRDGTIIEAKIETPSGNGTFDRAALSAVRSASPLNPLPFGYSGTILGVRFTFR
jgi:protein TonB